MRREERADQRERHEQHDEEDTDLRSRLATSGAPHLLILDTKFGKSRIVVLHPSTADQLRTYLAASTNLPLYDHALDSIDRALGFVRHDAGSKRSRPVGVRIETRTAKTAASTTPMISHQ